MGRLVALLALGLALYPAVPAAAAPPTWAAAATAAVHPGVVVRTGDVACTSNYLFTDDTGALYLGMAALCAHRNARPADGPDGVHSNGCTFDSYPLGTPVELKGTGVRGTLAYSSWLAMRHWHELYSTCLDNNFALIRLPDSARDRANPSVPELGGPTGLATDFTPAGAKVVGYGNGPAHLDAAPLRPMPGEVLGDNGGGYAHLVTSLPPGLPGDSGAGYLDERGRAVGVLANLTLDPPGANTVIDLARVIDYAVQRGGLHGLRLIVGTEPFVGVPLVSGRS
jgi:hypothetical protein